MPTLLLLNGPPGVGKSTLAAQWAAADPARTHVDPDQWRARQPLPHTDEARLAAREEAAAAIDTHLAAGRTVAIAQLCGRPDFPDRLRDLADQRGANYLEVMLLDSLTHLQQRLRHRLSSTSAAHAMAARELDDDLLRAYREALVSRASADPTIMVLECQQDQQEITLRAIEHLTTAH
nr:AAA family ATPase [Demetria terragena]